jgi:hypothetical protein
VTTLEWKDSSGGLSVGLSHELGHDTADMTLEWHSPSGATAESLLPSLRLVSQLKAPNRIALRYSTETLLGPTSLPQVDDGNRLANYLRVVTLLARVQRRTDTAFPVPEELSQDDINALTRAERLLGGSTVNGTWREATLVVTPTSDGRRLLEKQGEEAAMILATEETLLIAGNTLPLGVVGIHFLSVHIKRRSSNRQDGRIRLTIVPGRSNEFESWLVSDEHTTVAQIIPGVSQQFRRQVAESMDQNDELLRRLAQ